MALIGSIIKDLVLTIGVGDGWKELSNANNYYDHAADAATDFIVDTVIRHSWARESFKGIMMWTNNMPVRHNNGKANQFSTGAQIPKDLQNWSWIGGIVTNLSNIDASVLMGIEEAGPGAVGAQTEWEALLAQPNIEGVPISASTVDTDRTVEISEQMVIQQDTGNKKYWTDNAVPRLKEWHIEGYITSALMLDQMYNIKPSLDFQVKFLDRCALTRKPVLFKTNRGEFVFVQIMNLKTTTDATYNNAIKVSISLKEFNPYTIRDNTTMIQIQKKAQEDYEKKSRDAQKVVDADVMGGCTKANSFGLGISDDAYNALKPGDKLPAIPGLPQTSSKSKEGWTVYAVGAQYGF